MISTFESETIECAICKRITSKNHATQYTDIWICYWCEK
jgi:hypothetical protein